MVRRIIVLLAVITTVASGVTAAFAAAPGVNEQDRAFLTATHQGNLAEIEAGKVAEKQGSTERVRNAGRVLVDEHTKLDKEVRRVADEVGVTLPDTPSEEQQAQLQRISDKKGAEFDSAWVTAGIADHRDDLKAGADEQANGSSKPVKDLGAAAKPVNESHLSLLEKLQTA
jgi:putative membrane protein